MQKKKMIYIETPFSCSFWRKTTTNGGYFTNDNNNKKTTKTTYAKVNIVNFLSKLSPTHLTSTPGKQSFKKSHLAAAVSVYVIYGFSFWPIFASQLARENSSVTVNVEVFILLFLWRRQ